MRNIFVQISYTKFGGEAGPKPFYKKRKINMSLYQQYEMFAFIVCPIWHLLLPYIKLFQKTRRGLELVSLPHYQHDFCKNVSLAIFY